MAVAKKPTRKPTNKKPVNKKPKKKPAIPESAAAKAARQSIIMADLMGIEADRARLSEISKGGYGGGVRLRAGGSSLSSYRIGKPKADKGYKRMITGGAPKGKPGQKKKR